MGIGDGHGVCMCVCVRTPMHVYMCACGMTECVAGRKDLHKSELPRANADL